MAKRDIERALKAKGLRAQELEFDRAIATPEEFVGAWLITLDEDSEDRVLSRDRDATIQPDCANTDEALAWIATLPDCRPQSSPK